MVAQSAYDAPVYGLNPRQRDNLRAQLAAALDGGKPYVMAASFSTRPGIKLGTRVIPLAADALFGASQSLPAVFQGFQGYLNAQGRAVGVIQVPALPALKGLSVYVAGVILDPASPFGVGTVTNAAHVMLR